MTKRQGIARYSAVELQQRRARGESLSDFAAVRAKTEVELDLDIAGDPDFRDVPSNWHEAALAVMPSPKKLLSLRLDADVVDWFRKQGAGYQTRMNAVLKAYVTQRGKKAAGPS